MSNRRFNVRGGTAVRSMRGTSMIEVLVTIVILAIGLLGMAGLEARLQASEMEAYQRAQALILLNDMASRLSTNRANAVIYANLAPLGAPLGAGMTCPTDTSTLANADASQWCNVLQGAAETATNGKVGAMIGGRGCVESIGSGQYLITVAWQGLRPLSAPPDSVACGKNLYQGGTGCASDACRRAVTTIVRITDLSNPGPASP